MFMFVIVCSDFVETEPVQGFYSFNSTGHYTFLYSISADIICALSSLVNYYATADLSFFTLAFHILPLCIEKLFALL